MQRDKIEKNPLLRLSIAFSIAVIEYCKLLNKANKFVLSRQLLPAGTSVGANAIEAQNAESRADFIHKIKIAAKEADETQYWLILCSSVEDYPVCTYLLPQLEELQKILDTILGSSGKGSLTHNNFLEKG